MNRALALFNFAGVLLLAALCVLQWNANRGLQLNRIDLEKNLQADQAQLGDKDREIKSQAADLNDFRGRVGKLSEALDQSDAQQKKNAADRDAISGQRDQLQKQVADLKAGVDQWQAAVAARDKALQETAAELKQAAADRNDAVQKFNDLAKEYNAAQDQLKKAADMLQSLAAERNDVVKKFNDLAAKYNALVRRQTPGTSQP